MINIKIFFAVLLVNIYPQMSGSDQMNCPLLDINFSGNDLACIRDVSTYHDCGKLCHNMYLPDSCRYWSWYSINHYCCLKHSDSGLSNNEDWISGDSNCYWCHEEFKKGITTNSVWIVWFEQEKESKKTIVCLLAIFRIEINIVEWPPWL